MHELLVERKRLADAVQVCRVPVWCDLLANRAEVGAYRERRLVRRRRRLLHRRLDVARHINVGRSLRKRGVPDRPRLTVGTKERDVVAVVVFGLDGDVLAVVDRSAETHVHDTARQELLAPCRRERLRRIGEDLDARHQRTGETELSRDLVVVDLVVGVRREVAGPDGVRRRLAHRTQTNCETATAANSNDRYVIDNRNRPSGCGASPRTTRRCSRCASATNHTPSTAADTAYSQPAPNGTSSNDAATIAHE